MKLEGYRDFIRICGQTESAEMLEKILELLLTPEEKENIGTRIQLIRELLCAENTQREIAKKLKISIAKITRGSNNLKLLNDETKQYLTKTLIHK